MKRADTYRWDRDGNDSDEDDIVEIPDRVRQPRLSTRSPLKPAPPIFIPTPIVTAPSALPTRSPLKAAPPMSIPTPIVTAPSALPARSLLKPASVSIPTPAPVLGPISRAYQNIQNAFEQLARLSYPRVSAPPPFVGPVFDVPTRPDSILLRAVILANQDGSDRTLDALRLLIRNRSHRHALDTVSEADDTHTFYYGVVATAVLLGSASVVDILLRDRHASPNVPLLNRDRQDTYTPLMLAVLRNDWDMVELLLASPIPCNVNLENFVNHWTALTYACRTNRVDIVRRLLETQPDLRRDGLSLRVACEVGNVHIVELLLLAGADPDAPCAYDPRTPLIYAARNGHMHIVRLLLLAGANPEDEIEVEGRTESARHVAPRFLHEYFTDLLEEYRANHEEIQARADDFRRLRSRRAPSVSLTPIPSPIYSREPSLILDDGDDDRSTQPISPPSTSRDDFPSRSPSFDYESEAYYESHQGLPRRQYTQSGNISTDSDSDTEMSPAV